MAPLRLVGNAGDVELMALRCELVLVKQYGGFPKSTVAHFVAQNK